MEAAYKNDAAPVDQVIWTPVHIMNRMTTNVNSWSYSDDFPRGDSSDGDSFGHLYGLYNTRQRWLDW
jgi:hypothetical protein